MYANLIRLIQSLKISNYALIEKLKIDFNKGFTVITGETGAGKSILLGALGLLLGNRADISVLSNKESKCVVEAVFDISKFNLKKVFEENDADYEDLMLVRREILPNGRSRSFVNDTPVNLSFLKIISDELIDVHSQHENAKISKPDFKREIVDIISNSDDLLSDYKENYKQYTEAKKHLENLIKSSEELKKDADYNFFRYEELLNANLKDGELEHLEAEYKTLNNAEQIIQRFSTSFNLINKEDVGALHVLNECFSEIEKTADINNEFAQLSERLKSVCVELEDINSDIEKFVDTIEVNPKKAEEINNKLNTIYDLQQKHRVSTVEELIDIREQLKEKVDQTESLEEDILKAEKEKNICEEKAFKTAERLSKSRETAVPEIEKRIAELLKQLAMPSAEFKINIEKLNELHSFGIDNINFLFSANKNTELREPEKIASGGEVSRLMLAIKSVIAESANLPTIIFDEIDTGISGEVANKAAELMKQTAKFMQVITITHLPQVAAKGDNHLYVYKEEQDTKTITDIKALNKNERITETAKLLSGDKITEAALLNAQELLKI